MTTTITANDIQLDGIGKYISLDKLQVNIEVNCHATLTLSCVISYEQVMTINQSGIQEISVDILNHDLSGHFFYGLCSTYSIQHIGAVYYLYAEAISMTRCMDIEYKSRSFQNINDSYKDIIESIMSVYLQHNEIFVSDRLFLPTEELLLQYQETDWNFIKRIASLTHCYVCPDMCNDGIQYYIGIPDGAIRAEKKEALIVSNKLAEYNDFQDNNLVFSCEPKEWVEYTFLRRNYPVRLGDRIQLDGNIFHVKKADMEYSAKIGVLQSTITVGKRSAQWKSKFYSKRIKGLALRGTVIDRIHEFSKVHLDIDQTQDIETATWFREANYFSAGDYKGWTGMNEIGDRVDIYFPSHKENDAYILRVVRQDYGKTNQSMQRLNAVASQNAAPGGSTQLPQYFSAPNGQEILMNGDTIMFSASESASYLQIDANSGIYVHATESMSLTALNGNVGKPVNGKGTSSIPSEHIQVKSGKKTVIQSGNSAIKIENNEIEITSYQIHEIVDK